MGFVVLGLVGDTCFPVWLGSRCVISNCLGCYSGWVMGFWLVCLGYDLDDLLRVVLLFWDCLLWDVLWYLMPRDGCFLTVELSLCLGFDGFFAFA